MEMQEDGVRCPTSFLSPLFASLQTHVFHLLGSENRAADCFDLFWAAPVGQSWIYVARWLSQVKFTVAVRWMTTCCWRNLSGMEIDLQINLGSLETAGLPETSSDVFDRMRSDQQGNEVCLPLQKLRRKHLLQRWGLWPWSSTLSQLLPVSSNQTSSTFPILLKCDLFRSWLTVWQRLISELLYTRVLPEAACT